MMSESFAVEGGYYCLHLTRTCLKLGKRAAQNREQNLHAVLGLARLAQVGQHALGEELGELRPIAGCRENESRKWGSSDN